MLSASVNLDVKHYLACRGKDVESALISRGLGEGAQEFTVFSKYDETRVMVRGADIFPYPLTGP